MGSLFTKVRDKIRKNKEIKEGGGFIGIPNPFPRLYEYVPVFERGMSIGVLGPTGSGKSRFARFLFLYHVYKFYKETGYKVKVVYFPLEDNKEKVYRNIICNYLKEEHNIYITLQELDSKGDRHLPDFVLEKLEEADEYFSDFEEVVYILDGENEPSKIYETCRGIALSLGKVTSYMAELPNGEQKKQYRYESDYHVICIVDNLSNVDAENGDNEHSAINKFAKDIIRGKLCNFFNWTVVQIMQLDFESERQSFNKQGETIIGKIEPSLSGVGDSKRVTRSQHLIFALFNPSRFDILKFPIPPKSNPQAYYDIEVLANKFRSLRVLKSNDTDVGMRTGLLFDGVAETFLELPVPDSPEMKEIYAKISGKPKFIKAQNQLKFDEDDTPF